MRIRCLSISTGTIISKAALVMSSESRSLSPVSDLRLSYLRTRSSSCSIAALTESQDLTRSGFKIARRMFLFLPAVEGSHLLCNFLHASYPNLEPMTMPSDSPFVKDERSRNNWSCQPARTHGSPRFDLRHHSSTVSNSFPKMLVTRLLTVRTHLRKPCSSLWKCSGLPIPFVSTRSFLGSSFLNACAKSPIPWANAANLPAVLPVPPE